MVECCLSLFGSVAVAAFFALTLALCLALAFAFAAGVIGLLLAFTAGFAFALALVLTALFAFAAFLLGCRVSSSIAAICGGRGASTACGRNEASCSSYSDLV